MNLLVYLQKLTSLPCKQLVMRDGVILHALDILFYRFALQNRIVHYHFRAEHDRLHTETAVENVDLVGGVILRLQ